MKKTNLIKVVTIILISIMVILFSTSVFAADNDDITILTLNNTNKTNTNTNTNKTNTNTNTNKTNTNTNKTNTNNTNNSSVYNNTDLPKTGVESSIPVVALVVAFGVSAVYAYRKISDYRNI